MTRAALALVLVGCGRIAFAPLDDSGIVDGVTTDAVDSSLRAWFAFEDDMSDGALDSSPAAAHASCQTNCPISTMAGRHGNAALFDSNGAALSALVDVPAVDFTWTVWVRLATAQPFGAVVSLHGENGLSPGGAEIAVLAGQYLVFTNGDQVMSGDSLPVGTWAHVALARTASTIFQYIDGVLVNTSADAVAHDFGGCRMLIGVDADSGCTGSLNGYLDAALDELRVYARVLTAVEIAADAASATPLPPP